MTVEVYTEQDNQPVAVHFTTMGARLGFTNAPPPYRPRLTENPVDALTAADRQWLIDRGARWLR